MARRGFTLVELLVVIAIIGILIAMLLPAIQQARESSRRISCTSNVKQLALAVQNYESVYQMLPAAGTYADPEIAKKFSYSYWRLDLKSGTNYSWITAILPFIEETPLYDQFDFSVEVTNNPLDPQRHQLPVLTCPTDSTAGRMFEVASPTGVVEFGKANYAAWGNPYHVDSLFYTGAISSYGQPLRRITDGTSSTLLLAEIRTRDHRSDQRGAWALPWSGASLLAFDLHPMVSVKKDGENIDVGYIPNSISFGVTQPPNSLQPDVLYECPEPAAEQLDRMPCSNHWFGYISAAPRSLHQGGVNAAFLDGHVAFLPDEIDELSMVYMVDTTDGEQIDQRY